MTRAALRKTLAGLGIAAFAVCAALLLNQAPLLRTVEWKIYDLLIRHTAGPAKARSDIVMVEIDDQSIERMAENGFGRFPWPRDSYAVLLRYLEKARPKAVAFDLLLLEEDRGPEGASRDRELIEATRRMGNVIHSVAVSDSYVSAPPSAPGGYRLGREVEEHRSVKLPFGELGSASRALGHTFLVLDEDGPVRRAVPFVRQKDNYYPSLAVATTMAVLGIEPSRVRLDRDGLHLGDLSIPLIDLDVEYVEKIRARHMLVNYRAPAFRDAARTERVYRTYKFWDLLLSQAQLEDGRTPAIDPQSFRDKIVFVGTTASGLHDVFQTPFGETGKFPGMQIHASVVDDILSRSFLRPAPRGWALALLVVCAALVGVAGVTFNFWWASLVALVVASGGAAAVLLLFRQGTWLPSVPAITGLLVAQFASVAYSYFVEGRSKRQIRALFSRYVSPEVVKELIEDPSKARLGGERREMTVLFSDIRGFTTFSESRDPEDVIRQLNEYFSRMVELLFEHKGTLDKFVGDMIMGLFNAPVREPDHADNAVRMGLAMLGELKVLNERWGQEGRPALDIGVGINTGDMIVGNVGSERTLSYTVIGDNVNLGSRLESLNKEFSSHIIISEFTRNRLRGDYFIRPLGKVKVKGKNREVAIFEVCVSEEELRAKEARAAEPSSAAAH